jgi:5-amino-6-(5-phospho-D-ribitylamino)uracil phosphatase
MEKKLIAIDLDGTTLNSQGQVSEKTIKILNQIVKLGHIVTIVSGRPPRLIHDIYHKIGLDTPLISFNGSLGFNPVKNWEKSYEYNINKNIVFDILDHQNDIGVNLMAAEGKTSFFANKESNTTIGFFPTKLSQEEIITKDNLTEDPICLTLQINPSKMKSFTEYITKNYSDNLKISPWGGKDSIVELATKDISKKTGLEVLTQYYNIHPKNTIAFGDEFNDETMIDFAGLGVAMKNGQPKIKNKANDITKYDNNHDGLANYLKNYFSL